MCLIGVKPVEDVIYLYPYKNEIVFLLHSIENFSFKHEKIDFQNMFLFIFKSSIFSLGNINVLM